MKRTKTIYDLYPVEFQVDIALAYLSGFIEGRCIKAKRVLEKKQSDFETKYKKLL